jgi:formylmethanofuran dehydrogenase subunit E-like metal-binding protein
MSNFVGMLFQFIPRMELTVNRVLKITVLCLMLLWPLGENANAADIRSAIRHGLKDLGAGKGQTGLCVLTDATYVKVDGMTSEPLVDVIREETGCTVGKGNLLFFHRPVDYLLKIAIFRKDTEACMVISYDGKRIERKKYDFGGEAVAKSSFWIEADAPLAPDTRTIVYFAKAWAAGAPYDLLKCLEFHNHLCPGILSGYLIVQYIAERYPLKKGEAYTWFAYPPWCKDDALQVLLDLTAGKKDLYARNLAGSQKEELTFKNPAGLLTIWNAEKKTGKGIVFRFDWDKVRTKDRLRTVFDLLEYTENPEELVGVVKECELTPEMMEKLKTAEPNPYTWLGLTK